MDDGRPGSPFGAKSTAAKVVDGFDLTGRRAAVAGGFRRL
jgi:hypothetical protein